MKTLTIAATFILIPFSVKAQVDTTSEIDVYNKIAGLTQFWSEAKYNFAFFDQTDVDWDNALTEFISKVMESKSTWGYYQVLKEFSALLNDGHTDINLPGHLFKETLYRPVNFGFSDGTYKKALPLKHQ